MTHSKAHVSRVCINGADMPLEYCDIAEIRRDVSNACPPTRRLPGDHVEITEIGDAGPVVLPLPHPDATRARPDADHAGRRFAPRPYWIPPGPREAGPMLGNRGGIVLMDEIAGEEDRALEGGWIREAIAREARGRAAQEADRLLARSEAIGRALLGLVLILAAALAGLLLGGW